MRYCTRCGNALENGDICTRCGTDNRRDTADNTGRNSSHQIGEESILRKTVPVILHWAALFFFAVTACIMLRNTFADAFVRVNDMMISRGSVLFVTMYFAVSLWSIIASVCLLMNGRRNRNDAAIIASFTVLFFVILSFIVQAVSEKLPEELEIFPSMLAVYRNEVRQIVIPAVLSIAAGIAGNKQETRATEKRQK